LRLLNTLSSRDARDKLNIILGPEKAARLFAEIDAVGKQFATRQAVATGSATGRREARSRALDDTLAPGPVGKLAEGAPIRGAQALIQFLTRQTPENMQAQRQKVLTEVATALTQKRGPEAAVALKVVERALSGQPIKSQEAAMIGRLVGASVSLSGYQSAQKYISSPQSAR
jgi:hypothetical protein